MDSARTSAQHGRDLLKLLRELLGGRSFDGHGKDSDLWNVNLQVKILLHVAARRPA